MVFRIFLLILFVHKSLAEELRSQRDIDTRQYDPVTDTLDDKEGTRASKSMYIKEVNIFYQNLYLDLKYIFLMHT